MTPRQNQRHTAFLITMRQSPATIRPLEAVWRRGINCWLLIGWMIRMAAKTSGDRWIVWGCAFALGKSTGSTMLKYLYLRAFRAALTAIRHHDSARLAYPNDQSGRTKRPLLQAGTGGSTQPSDTLSIAAQCSWKMISGNITTQTKTHKRKSRCTQLSINATPRQ